MFVDEMGSNTSLLELYAYSPRGERAYCSVARNRGKNTTLLASMSLSGMGPSMLEERHAEVARENVRRAGLGERVEVRVGDAVDLLSAMADGDERPFDLIFIDADEGGYPEYLKWALKLSRPGSLILADNTIRGGGVLEPRDESSQGVREYNRMVSEDERLSATILPFFKNRVDGLTLARVSTRL